MLHYNIYNKDTMGEIHGSYVHGTRFGDWFFTAHVANLPDGSIVSDDMYQQTIQVFKNIRAALAEVGGDMQNILSLHISLTDINERAEFNRAYAEIFNFKPLPSRAIVEVSALVPGCKVEVEAVCNLMK